MATQEYTAVFVKKDTHKFLLMEKHKRSIEYSKTVTFDQLIKELLSESKK